MTGTHGSRLAAAGLLLLAGCSVGEDMAGPFADEETEPANGNTWDPVGDESGSEGADTGAPEEDGIAGSGALRRLTVAQYENTVRDLLGEPLVFSAGLEDVIPLLDNGEYMSVAAARDGFSQNAIHAWFTGTLATVQPVFDDADRRLALVGCTPATADDECARSFLASFGRRAYRRSLASEEIDLLVEVATTAQSELAGSPWTGLHYATATILQSPSMLYIPEIGEPVDGNRHRYTSVEMASRLAFALTNRGPDVALLDAGESGELVDPAKIRMHAQRLLDDPRGRTSIVEDMFGQYLNLRALDGLGKDPEQYPKWNTGVAAALREEARLLFDWAIYEEELTLPELLVNRTTFVDAQLADLYGMDAPQGDGFARFDIPDDWQRIGLLGLGSFLAINGKSGRTAPTLRGRWIQFRVLCKDDLEAPPPDVEPLPEIPADGEHQTMRERMEQHTAAPVCQTCHMHMDPPGFALENFDGIGGHRQTDNGLELDVSGTLDGVAFDGPVELATVLSDHPELRGCFARQIYRYASGTSERNNDELVASLVAIGDETDANVRDLLVELVASEGFRHFRSEGE
jgi:hypothetical protein